MERILSDEGVKEGLATQKFDADGNSVFEVVVDFELNVDLIEIGLIWISKRGEEIASRVNCPDALN